jgi:ACT domain-containing protein
MAFHLSIFVQNKPGQLEKITKILSDNQINLRAFSMASAGDFGVVKVVVGDIEKAYQALKQENITVSKRKIIIGKVPDRPGGLYHLLNLLSSNKINIEDCYGFMLEKQKEAAIVVEVEKYPMTEEILKSNGVTILTDQDLIFI